jgi:hypothetical protein
LFFLGNLALLPIFPTSTYEGVARNILHNRLLAGKSEYNVMAQLHFVFHSIFGGRFDPAGAPGDDANDCHNLSPHRQGPFRGPSWP